MIGATAFMPSIVRSTTAPKANNPLVYDQVAYLATIGLIADTRLGSNQMRKAKEFFAQFSSIGDMSATRVLSDITLSEVKTAYDELAKVITSVYVTKDEHGKEVQNKSYDFKGGISMTVSLHGVLGAVSPWFLRTIGAIFDSSDTTYHGIFTLGQTKVIPKDDEEKDGKKTLLGAETLNKTAGFCIAYSSIKKPAKGNDLTQALRVFPENHPFVLSAYEKVKKALVNKPTPLIEEAASSNPEIRKKYPVGVVIWYPNIATKSNATNNLVTMFSRSCHSNTLSKCVPFLDIKMLSRRASVVKDAGGTNKFGKSDVVFDLMSQGRFVDESIKDLNQYWDPKSAETNALKPIMAKSTSTLKSLHPLAGTSAQVDQVGTLIAAARPVEPPPFDTKDFAIVAGLESFCTPQIPLGGKSRAFSTESSDPNRPFMSVLDFSVNVRGIGGTMAEKTAKLKVKLHDVAKMSLISPILSPSGYGSVRIMVTYGWSHPGSKSKYDIIGSNAGEFQSPTGTYKPTEDNVAIHDHAAIIVDAMKVREYYTVLQSKFSIEGSEVTIDLDLSMLSTEASSDVDLAAQFRKGSVPFKDLERTVSSVSKVLTSMQGNGAYADIKIPAFVMGINSDSLFSLTSEQVKIVRVLQERLTKLKDDSSNSIVKDLSDSLAELFGTKGKKGKKSIVESYGESLVKAFQKKFDALNKDPYLIAHHPSILSVKTASGVGPYKKKTASSIHKTNGFATQNTKNFISLGYLLTAFLGPSYNEYNGGQEVLFVFNACNPNSAASFNSNLAHIPLDRKKIRARLSNLFKGNFKVDPRTFVAAIGDHLSSQTAYCYGLYSKGKAKTPNPKSKAFSAPMMTDKDYVLREYYGDLAESAPVFQPIKLEIIVEGAPSEVSMEEDKNVPGFNLQQFKAVTTPVVRITVVDAANSYTQPIEDLLNAENSAGVTMLPSRHTADDSPFNKFNPMHELVYKHVMKKVANSSALYEKLEEGASFMKAKKSAKEITDYFDKPDKVLKKLKGKYDLLDKATFIKNNIPPPILKKAISGILPTLDVGVEATAVISANLATETDSQIFSVRLLRQPDTDASTSEMPMTIMPSELDLQLYGCPIIQYGSRFFVDLQTNTTADGFYRIISVDHTISSGEFLTSLKLVPDFSYGRYTSIYYTAAKAALGLSTVSDKRGIMSPLQALRKREAWNNPGD